MKFGKVLIANLISHEHALIRRRSVLRAGMGYIAERLERNGVSCRITDLALGGNASTLISEIKDFSPDLLGVSMFTYKYLHAYKILEKVKSRFPLLPIICGGPHISTFREKALEECGAIDYGIVGEADDEIVSFIKGENSGNIKGFLWRENGNIHFNDTIPYVSHLDKLHFPRYGGFRLSDYPLMNSPVHERIIPIVTSRGCPYECVYCTVKLSLCRKFRHRSVPGIMEELKYWHAIGYRKFSFVDDNFTLLRERVEKLCDAMKEAELDGISISLGNGIRADKVDFPLLKKMRETGFSHVGIGVESGNDRILKALKKGETIKTITAAVESAVKAGYEVDLYMLVGSPEETEKEVWDSINFASGFNVNSIFYFNLIPYPRTELFEWVRKNGKFIFPPEYYLNEIHSNMDEPVFETGKFPRSARKKMLKTAKKEEKERKRRRYLAKLTSKGFPEIIASPLSKIYSSKITQLAFNDIPALRKLKERFK